MLGLIRRQMVLSIVPWHHHLFLTQFMYQKEQYNGKEQQKITIEKNKELVPNVGKKIEFRILAAENL